MADRVTPEQRSINMQHVRGKNTTPEIYLRKLLFEKGYRYRIHSKSIPGHPDIWSRKYNTALFVHGCFWHRHNGCKYASTPQTRTAFWEKKFLQNMNRDFEVKQNLHSLGIKCLVVWECTIKKMHKDKKTEDEIIASIENFFRSDSMFLEL